MPALLRYVYHTLLPPLLQLCQLLLAEVAYVLGEVPQPYGVGPGIYAAQSQLLVAHAAKQQAAQGEQQHVPAFQCSRSTGSSKQMPWILVCRCNLRAEAALFPSHNTRLLCRAYTMRH